MGLERDQYYTLLLGGHRRRYRRKDADATMPRGNLMNHNKVHRDPNLAYKEADGPAPSTMTGRPDEHELIVG